MILEHLILSIVPGREEEFEAAFAAAPAVFARAEGCHGIELRRCHEEPSRYLMFVWWDSVEHHMAGFRESPLFSEWRGLVGEFFAAPPAMEHYRPVA